MPVQVGGLLGGGGGGAKGMLAPLPNYWGGLAPHLPTPMLKEHAKVKEFTLMFLTIGIPKTINFPFMNNGK